ncbi:MAG: hypothetical protein ACR2QK_12410, partial [Acidimicrobiales bacterium]
MRGGSGRWFGFRLVLAVGRWVLWTVLGHPIGLSLFIAASILSLPVPFALGLALLLDLVVVAIGSRTRAGPALRRWSNNMRVRRSQPTAGRARPADRQDLDRGVPELRGQPDADPSAGAGRRSACGEDPPRPQLTGWVIGLSGTASAEGFD